MSTHYHAVLWLDHHEARIIHFSADDSDSERVRPADPPRHLHVKAGSASGTHITEEPQFYNDIVGALGDTQEILIAGPSTAKMEFVKYLNKHAEPAARHVVGVETLDRLTDKQLLVEARKILRAGGSLQTTDLTVRHVIGPTGPLSWCGSLRDFDGKFRGRRVTVNAHDKNLPP